MNKKLKKRLLIIIGLILIVLNYIINYSKDNIFEAILMMPIIALVEPYGSRGILFIFGISFLAWGLIIKEENVSRTADNKKNSIIKYKIMRLFGYVPFIGILCAAFFFAIVGLSFFTSTGYGWDAFWWTIILGSVCIWPTYIIGAIIIHKTSVNIKKLEEEEQNNLRKVENKFKI